MDKVKKWSMQCKAKEIVGILNDKGYVGLYAENLEEAKKLIIDKIPQGSSIALGGSVTLNDMEMTDLVRNGDYDFYDRYDGSKSWPDIVQVMRESLLADYLITGTNAITKNGELVNVDSSGNRVAGMIFGPKNVIVVTGANKVVDTLDDAFKRIREIAPLNVKRIGHQTPCAETGKCMNCDTPSRMCNYTTIIHNGMKFENRITVIVIAEELGY